jgi:serine/threonine-protein kinase
MVKDGTVDHRADLYAVGCVAFWLLTGRLVFDEESPMKLAISHASKTPEAPSHFTEIPVPPDLETVVMDCLQKEPSARPVDAEELGQRLAECDIGAVWDGGRAEKWWRAHLPEQVAETPLSLELRAV